MKRIALSLLIVAFSATAVVDAKNSFTSILQNPKLQRALAAAGTMLVGAGASLFKNPSAEFLKAFGIMGLLQLIPEFANALQASTWSTTRDLESAVSNLSMIIPLYNLQAALRSIMKEEPDFTACGNHVKSALRNIIALLAAAGCKYTGRAMYGFVTAKA